ncbi:MAG: hypothetical protein ACE360_04035 [Hyphomicrobiales bacterium]
MRNPLLLLAAAITLSACQSDAFLLEALNYDVGPLPETNTLQLAGTSLNTSGNRGMSIEQASAFFGDHRGSTVNYFGIVEDIRIQGNRAELELLPITTSIAKRECEVADLRRRYGCREQATRSFTTVTCLVHDWPALNQATGGRLLANWRNREADHRNWDSLHVEGTLTLLRPEQRRYGRYRNGNLRFGQLGGLRTVTWSYDSFLIDHCQVRGYDEEIL